MDNEFTVDGAMYSPSRVLIIAELGTGHGADLGKARELIDAAADAGADCVKFQLVYADEILHPNTGEVPLPGGNIRLYDRFRQLELPLDFFAALKSYAESRKMVFLCTPFGIRSARELRSLGPAAIKIASPELNFTALINEIASYGLPTFLSSGVSTLADIERALTPFDGLPACLLHCVTAYPAPESDYRLRVLTSLRSIFGVPVGVSDHSLDPVLVPSLSVAMGACAIEKHFCLSRSDPGLDDPIALPAEDFTRMVRAIRNAAAVGPEATIATLSAEYGAELIGDILGDGVKRLAASEKMNYRRTNRSVHALRDIEPGQTIVAADIGVLRTEKVLRPGMDPSFAEALVGHRARAFIPAGEGIRFEDI